MLREKVVADNVVLTPSTFGEITVIRAMKFVAFFGSALVAAVIIVGAPVAASPGTLTSVTQDFQATGDAMTVTITPQGVLEAVRMVLLAALAFCVMMFFVRLSGWIHTMVKHRKMLREWETQQESGN